jgi:hypothetical protein
MIDEGLITEWIHEQSFVCPFDYLQLSGGGNLATFPLFLIPS